MQSRNVGYLHVYISNHATLPNALFVKKSTTQAVEKTTTEKVYNPGATLHSQRFRTVDRTYTETEYGDILIPLWNMHKIMNPSCMSCYKNVAINNSSHQL